MGIQACFNGKINDELQKIETEIHFLEKFIYSLKHHSNKITVLNTNLIILIVVNNCDIAMNNICTLDLMLFDNEL
jgi:hypothetical protein